MRSILTASLSVMFAGTALAQQNNNAASSAAPTPPPTGAAQRAVPNAPQITAADAAREAAGLYGQAGNSLAQAGMAMPASPGLTMDNVSFFAVPAPKPRVIQKHDLVTIVIREQSEFSSDGKAESKKDAELQAAINQFIRLNINNLSFENAIGGVKPSVDLTGSRNFTGEGKVDRNDSFTARLTAEVVDVKPNGNLVLAARKRIVNDDEEQVFLIAGIARAQDITADNSILSTQLYDLDLRKMSKGAVRKATERGVLPKLLDELNLW
jgi:flagellar L-ring protein precursor FlgH